MKLRSLYHICLYNLVNYFTLIVKQCLTTSSCWMIASWVLHQYKYSMDLEYLA